MPLVELNLDGNRLCDSFREKADYIRYWESGQKLPTPPDSGPGAPARTGSD